MKLCFSLHNAWLTGFFVENILKGYLGYFSRLFHPLSLNHVKMVVCAEYPSLFWKRRDFLQGDCFCKTEIYISFSVLFMLHFIFASVPIFSTRLKQGMFILYAYIFSV